MISRLRGEVVTRSPTGVVLDVAGVGYLVNPTDSARRQAEPGKEVVLETYLHVREDTRVRVARATIADFELSFHAIEVHGDAAVVYYIIAVINSTTSSNAAPDKTRACITHTWIRDRGAWRLAGGMSRPSEGG